MSGLAALLAGRVPCEVVRWTSAYEADEVAHVVTHAGWEFSHVDGWLVGDTKDDVLAALGTALGFAPTYGRNLDALADSLRDLSDEGGRVLLWDGWSVLARADERVFRLVVEILGERAGDPGATPFAVLLRGEGPEVVGIGELD
ncbi:MAG: barstar family protein [Nocardioides sp.]|uniref:barstar family protein n=1 Tax=Nocardioides sp. TaxID=35761 RepID=UPI003F05722D